MKGTGRGASVSVVVVIEGREAIPVRAIPLLTNWQTMGPDAVAQALAGDQDSFQLRDLRAYRINDGKLRSVDATWWESYPCSQLEDLSVEEFPHLKKKYWGRHFWARGYFCATVGQMTEEMIKQYLEHQDRKSVV